MAFLHKISGYLVDVNEDYFEEDIVTEIEQGMDLFSQHLHVESWELAGAKMVQVDGEKIKADTYYRCVDGEVVEADE